ncbi:MAG: YggS family pyridoxal phosphate-dependent enzyme [Bacteroidales bacterium]
MADIEKLKTLFEELPDGVKLIAVSKTKPAEEIMELYNAGHRIFGESKAQELIAKQEVLPKDIEWHMVGHLQTNKVKYLVPFVTLIHSVDSLKLLKEINKQGRKHDRVIPCLLQMHIAEESSKFGLDYEETCDLLESDVYREMQHVEILGLMGMATFTSDNEKIRKEFRQLRQHFSNLRKKYFSGKENFSEISMGMSSDYQLAIEEGSTMVRIGSSIFGERQTSET